jgi:hypothetical protein
VALPQQLKIVPCSWDFYRCARKRCATQNHSISATPSGGSGPREGRRLRGRLSWSRWYGRVPEENPAPAKLGRGHRNPPGGLPISLDHIERRAGTSIWTNDPKPAALRICWAQWLSLRAGNWRELSVQFVLIVIQVPEENPIETGIFGGAENSLGAPCVTGLLVLEQTIFRDQDSAVAQSLRIRRQFFACLESLCEALSHRLRVGAVTIAS